MQEDKRAYGLPTVWKAKNAQRPREDSTYQKRQLLQEYVLRLKSMGFEGMTGYVYHNFMEKDNKSYEDMCETFRRHWNRWSEKFKDDPNFEYQAPVAMGWDMRPGAVRGRSNPDSPVNRKKIRSIVIKHLSLPNSKKLSEFQGNISNGNTVMICCWNDYLEGNYIEPTEGHGFEYLEAIKEVFGPK